VNGEFTLDDASGSTLYDWSQSTTSGRVYATRNSTTIAWASVNCSNLTVMEIENNRMNHTSSDDNISATFDGTTHNSFFVGNVFIPANSCRTINTYVSNASQDSDFEEMSLYDGTSIIFATIVENDATGFDDNNYDFQMIVPENGAPSFTSSTAYYLYVELGS
jgi:hypothetical protein